MMCRSINCFQPFTNDCSGVSHVNYFLINLILDIPWSKANSIDECICNINNVSLQHHCQHIPYQRNSCKSIILHSRNFKWRYLSLTSLLFNNISDTNLKFANQITSILKNSNWDLWGQCCYDSTFLQPIDHIMWSWKDMNFSHSVILRRNRITHCDQPHSNKTTTSSSHRHWEHEFRRIKFFWSKFGNLLKRSALIISEHTQIVIPLKLSKKPFPPSQTKQHTSHETLSKPATSSILFREC